MMSFGDEVPVEAVLSPPEFLQKAPPLPARAIAEVAACSIVCDASSYRGHADRVVFAFSDLAAMTSVV